MIPLHQLPLFFRPGGMSIGSALAWDSAGCWKVSNTGRNALLGPENTVCPVFETLIFFSKTAPSFLPSFLPLPCPFLPLPSPPFLCLLLPSFSVRPVFETSPSLFLLLPSSFSFPPFPFPSFSLLPRPFFFSFLHLPSLSFLVVVSPRLSRGYPAGLSWLLVLGFVVVTPPASAPPTKEILVSDFLMIPRQVPTSNCFNHGFLRQAMDFVPKAPKCK